VLVPGPFFPVDSTLGRIATGVNGELREEIGWPELVGTTAAVYAALPPDERVRAGVLAGNYGEAGALSLYGPAHGLPAPISGVNSFWERGYGDPPPTTLVVLGFERARAERLFRSCAVAARLANPYDLPNEETIQHPEVLVCRDPLHPWSEVWPGFRWFG
jgi:hypothetical protein